LNVQAAAGGGSRTITLATGTRPTDGGQPVAAFTIDVEDWYQSSVDFDAPITERVVGNVERILRVLDEFAVKGTFFVQGRVAETFPAMVRTLVEDGHEVQSHGYSHRPLSGMNRDELREELQRARATVQDAAGVPVEAFRAQDFSIGSDNLWALEVIADVGFKVDSSIFPMRMSRYGIPGWEVAPHYVTFSSGGRLLEVPVAIWTIGRWRFPVAGGGYFRVLPRALLERAVRGIVGDGRPAIVYCHPYEFNPGELDGYAGEVSRRTRMAQNLGRRSFADRVRYLLDRIRFGRLDAVLEAWALR
jgi:polysaccharide deacetylase family protein (PEP-CTERM system associated)